MPIQVSKTNAKGNSGVDHSGPNNKTPAPTQAPRIRFGDDFGGKGDLNYGRNRQNLPSSVEPGATVESDLAKDLRTSVDDPALATIIGKGMARDLSVGDSTGRTLAQQGGDGLLRDLAASGTGHGTKGRPRPCTRPWPRLASMPEAPVATCRAASTRARRRSRSASRRDAMADRLTDLRLALVLGWTLPHWFVRNGWPQLVERCKDEVLPWSIDDTTRFLSVTE